MAILLYNLIDLPIVDRVTDGDFRIYLVQIKKKKGKSILLFLRYYQRFKGIKNIRLEMIKFITNYLGSLKI